MLGKPFEVWKQLWVIRLQPQKFLDFNLKRNLI